MIVRIFLIKSVEELTTFFTVKKILHLTIFIEIGYYKYRFKIHLHKLKEFLLASNYFLKYVNGKY